MLFNLISICITLIVNQTTGLLELVMSKNVLGVNHRQTC